jgi:RimJ/RimL family protein N-acetyltransferase
VQIATAPTDQDGRRFLLARGFEIAAVVRNSELDPRTVAPPAEPSPGLRVAPLAEVLGQAPALYRLYAEGRADVPSATPRPPWTFEEWRAETIDAPLIDLDASVVVFEDEEPVALAWLCSDRAGRRAEALMAATRRDRRGRGLATFAKIESARRASALGITRILTSNDLANAPMLAVNRRLGFAESAVAESFVKHIAGRDGTRPQAA